MRGGGVTPTREDCEIHTNSSKSVDLNRKRLIDFTQGAMCDAGDENVLVGLTLFWLVTRCSRCRRTLRARERFIDFCTKG